MSAANIGYLFTQDFYRDENAQETAELDETAIKRKTQDILKARPFDESGLLRRACLPCYTPAPQEAVVVAAGADVAALEAWAAQFNTRRTRERDASPIPQPPSPPTESKILRDQGISRISLKVLYPGLYAGMGYIHGQDGSDGDFKTGFSFDYTTGLPFIPGSSVKGALRACFIDRKADTLETVCDILESERDEQWLRCLEQRLFGSRSKESDTSAAMGTVIFYDAFPGKTSESLMAEDYITPHPNPLKSPMPIKTIKVKPGVCFDFFFRIPNIVLEAEDQQPRIEKKHVRELFERLLIDWGIGAKTNTGYGNFAKC